jgi:hypothetical protein
MNKNAACRVEFLISVSRINFYEVLMEFYIRAWAKISRLILGQIEHVKKRFWPRV